MSTATLRYARLDSAAYSQGLTAGVLTVADVRMGENHPRIANTDKINRPANMVPLEGEANGNAQPGF